MGWRTRRQADAGGSPALRGLKAKAREGGGKPTQGKDDAADGTRTMIQMYHVDKRYDAGTFGIRDISLSVQRGEFAFLTGSSGAGKTTLLRLLFGAERPSAGFGQEGLLIEGLLSDLSPLFVT